MKYLLLSALLLACPISFPSKWGMSLDAKTGHRKLSHTEAKALKNCLKCTNKDFREEAFYSINYLFKHQRYLETEVTRLQKEIYELQSEINLLKLSSHADGKKSV